MKILFKDKTFAIIEKEAGMAVTKNSHMSKDADYLNKIAANIFNCNIYNPHRLDAKTSGLIVLCFDKKTTEAFNALFRNKQINKTYHSIVKGNIPGSGTIDKPVFDRKKRKRLNAITHYKRIEQVATGEKDKNGDDLFLNLLEIKTETGRWHQIRQHLSSQKFDIIGDTQHGDWDMNKRIVNEFGFERLFLHASTLDFQHPETGENIRITSDIPVSFKELLSVWG